jgi:hypothetical protein
LVIPFAIVLLLTFELCFFEAFGATGRGPFPHLAQQLSPSVHAGAENRAEIHLQPLRELCQPLICRFHKFFAGFTLFSSIFA